MRTLTTATDWPSLLSKFLASQEKLPYVLLVDDTPGYVDALKQRILLELPGLDVRTAPGPIEALAVRNDLDGNLVVMSDHNMPDVYGIELLNQMRNNSRFRVFPILVTAREEYEIFSCAVRNGILFVSKNPRKDQEKNFDLGRICSDWIIYAINELSKQQDKDSLTGLDNTEYLYRIWVHDHGRAIRENTETSLIFADVDNLHHINTVYGEIAGDDAIKAVADALTLTARGQSSDCVFRYSKKADELGILMSKTKRVQGRVVFKRAEENTKNIKIDTPKGILHVHVSLGFASLRAKQLDPDPTIARNELFSLADANMKKRKLANKIARGENFER